MVADAVGSEAPPRTDRPTLSACSKSHARREAEQEQEHGHEARQMTDARDVLRVVAHDRAERGKCDALLALAVTEEHQANPAHDERGEQITLVETHGCLHQGAASPAKRK